MKKDCYTLADAVLASPEAVYQDGFREKCQKKKAEVSDVDEDNEAEKVRRKFWGESWEQKTARIRAESPYGGCVSWGLRGVIVKGGDDVRQELLASQIIRQFKSIFEAANLPLWLRPYEILVSCSTSGFLEYLPNTASIDSIKRDLNEQPFAEFFQEAFSDKLIKAKQNFIESCAGYSLVTYFLQIKDRHNGNLMLDRDGHLIHIDFGFMISLTFKTLLLQTNFPIVSKFVSDLHQIFCSKVIHRVM